MPGKVRTEVHTRAPGWSAKSTIDANFTIPYLPPLLLRIAKINDEHYMYSENGSYGIMHKVVIPTNRTLHAGNRIQSRIYHGHSNNFNPVTTYISATFLPMHSSQRIEAARRYSSVILVSAIHQQDD